MSIQSDKVVTLGDAQVLYDDLADRVVGLKSAINAELNPKTYTGWESGLYAPTSGDDYPSDIWIRKQTKYGISNGVCRINTNSGYKMRVYAWEGTTYIGDYKTDGTFKKTTTDYNIVTEFNCSLFPAYTFKIAIRREPASDQIQTSEGNNAIYNYFTDETLTVAHKAADAQATGVSINELKDFEEGTFDYITQFLDADNKTSGQYYYANLTTTGSASGYCTFQPVDVKAGVTYTLQNVRPHFCNFKTGSTVTTLDAADAGTANKTISYTPESDGQLYITGGDSANVMLFDADYRQTDYIYGKFYYTIKSDALGKKIEEDNCTFFKECEQYLKSANASSGYWTISNNRIDWSSNDNTKRYAAIKLKKDVTYSFTHVYGYFTIITDASGNVIERLTSNVSNNFSGTYTPSVDCWCYVSIMNTQYEVAMMCNDVEFRPSSYTEGVYYTYLDVNEKTKEINLHVKTDGTGDYTSVVSAVNYANAQSGSYPINIYIHPGDYNILTELGGDDFIDTIASSTDERQGLCLKRNNVNLIGVGYVVLRFEMPGTVTKTQSTRVSCLNLREFSNRVENLTLIAKNCRYVIHDETNGGNPYIHRVMKNLRCIHKGNASGLWEYPTVLGGGAGGGSTYDIINCQFITASYMQAFSYHTNTNEQASFFNIDGCVGSCNSSSGISFRFSYHGTGRTGICVANVKNCSGNGQTVVQAEASGDTDNNIEMYVNGWETIEMIPVTGNE